MDSSLEMELKRRNDEKRSIKYFMRKLVYIGFSFDHHSQTHGGYHQIFDYVSYDYKIDCSHFINKVNKKTDNLLLRIVRHLLRRMTSRPVIPWFVLKCIWLGLTRSDLTFHFIYGENSYYNIKPYIRSGNKVVCSFHQPVEWFYANCWVNRLKQIDEIILVGGKDLQYFQTITGKNNVSYIPHGIRTDFYCPDVTIKKEYMILTVGNWLRDYEFADKVYQQLLKDDHNLRIVVVALPQHLDCLNDNPRIQRCSGISDEKLRDLYQRCSLLFLPLKRYTANNSLLEASACGCNIVIASDSHDNSYIPANYLTMCSMDVKETISAIKKTMSVSVNINLVKYIQQKYSWEIIGKMIDNKIRW